MKRRSKTASLRKKKKNRFYGLSQHRDTEVQRKMDYFLLVGILVQADLPLGSAAFSRRV
jgi:hypothetical protein